MNGQLKFDEFMNITEEKSPEHKQERVPMVTVHPQECYENSYCTDEMKAGWNACLDRILK